MIAVFDPLFFFCICAVPRKIKAGSVSLASAWCPYYLFQLFLCLIFLALSIKANQKPWSPRRIRVVHGNGRGLHGVGWVTSDDYHIPFCGLEQMNCICYVRISAS